MNEGMGRRRMVSADEYDAYTGWRHIMCSFRRAGAVKKIKRRTHRRERRQARRALDGMRD